MDNNQFATYFVIIIIFGLIIWYLIKAKTNYDYNNLGKKKNKKIRFQTVGRWTGNCFSFDTVEFTSGYRVASQTPITPDKVVEPKDNIPVQFNGMPVAQGAEYFPEYEFNFLGKRYYGIAVPSGEKTIEARAYRACAVHIMVEITELNKYEVSSKAYELEGTLKKPNNRFKSLEEVLKTSWVSSNFYINILDASKAEEVLNNAFKEMKENELSE